MSLPWILALIVIGVISLGILCEWMSGEKKS